MRQLPSTDCALPEIETWNEENIGEAVAIIAHTAYHLGAIRQMAKNF